MPFFISSDNEVAYAAINDFYSKFSKLKSNDNSKTFGNYNNHILGLLTWLPLDNLDISVTSSESIFYRFSLIGHDLDFMWESFLDYDGDGNHGSTLQVYEGDSKIKSTAGDVDFIYATINKIAFGENEEEHTDKDEFFEISTPDLIYV